MVRYGWFDLLLALVVFAAWSLAVSDHLLRVTTGQGLRAGMNFQQQGDSGGRSPEPGASRNGDAGTVGDPAARDAASPRSADSGWTRRILCLYLPYFETDLVRRDLWTGASSATSGARRNGRTLPSGPPSARGLPPTDSQCGGPGESGHQAAPLVLTRRTGSSVFVVQVCPRAAAAGLVPGTTLGQAQASVPGLLALEYEQVRATGTLQRIARWSQRFSPLVQICPPRTLLIDVTGCGPLFGSERNLGQQAVGALLRRGLRVSCALADTPGAAWAVAHANHEALTVVPPGHSSAFLAPLPPSTLRLEPQTCQQLATLGVRTIGDLFVLPRAALFARFGPETVRRLQQALGEVIEPLADETLAGQPQSQLALEEPIQDCRVVRSLAGHLLEELFEQLSCRELSLGRLLVLASFANADPARLEIRLARPARSSGHVARLLSDRLEQLDLKNQAGTTPHAHVPETDCALPDGLLGLRLVAAETSPWRSRQVRMFDQADFEQEESLSVLIDQVRNRLGPDSVRRPELVDDHQPERSFHYVSAEIDQQAGDPSESEDGAGSERPARLLAEPQPLRVITGAGAGPPTWFASGPVEHLVQQSWGPQRVETAWWRGPDVRRDYYRVATDLGEQFWIYRDAVSGRWFLHGVFV